MASLPRLDVGDHGGIELPDRAQQPAVARRPIPWLALEPDWELLALGYRTALEVGEALIGRGVPGQAELERKR